ncbi:MAG: type VI secretion system protein TssA [Candidatus Competibacteraceae bacterium]|nr:type VI secretion system protein TssA [Candidatus Competibacteraceae bacterium]MCB1805515.1 type VI secretion system protein TssA [Candidatus Competibacteraceae bacterium]MCB1814667.1 type VI secretion system protein TssA [Candidatus Competibacteraceae bacterium]
MSDINLEHLLQPVSAEQPCGDDLEYDPEFQDMERAAQGKPETQFSEAEPPDWKNAHKRALKVLTRTRDFRPLLLLARASLKLGDWETFGQCIAIIPQWLEQYWEHVYPQLDPDDQDPEFRVNSIATLSQQPTQFNDQTFIKDLRDAPLVSSRAMGQFSMRDIDIAHGKLEVTFADDEEAPTEATISAAFAECPGEQLQATATAVAIAAEGIERCDAILTDKLGAAQAPDLSPFLRELSNASKILNEHLQARGLGSATYIADDNSTDQAAAQEASPDMTANSASPATSGQAFSGTISSRADVVRALDQICDYYRRCEPSSPIPLLLERAKRLASKSFLEILQDLAPGAVPELDAVRGRTSESAE